MSASWRRLPYSFWPWFWISRPSRRWLLPTIGRNGGANRDGVLHETGIIEKFASPEVPIAWRAKISSGYSGPTVAKGRVYVTDRVDEPTDRTRPRLRRRDW